MIQIHIFSFHKFFFFFLNIPTNKVEVRLLIRLCHCPVLLTSRKWYKDVSEFELQSCDASAKSACQGLFFAFYLAFLWLLFTGFCCCFVRRSSSGGWVCGWMEGWMFCQTTLSCTQVILSEIGGGKLAIYILMRYRICLGVCLWQNKMVVFMLEWDNVQSLFAV